MRVLVTGGAGLIGSHLCERLVREQHEVTCLDNFSSGAAENIAHLHDEPRFYVSEHDVQSPFPAPPGGRPWQRIFHLACPASPVHYSMDPVATVRTNVMGSIHALDAARMHSARVLLASTSEVYGDPLEHPQRESYWGHVNPNGPRACYDEGKRVAETLFCDYRRQYGTDVRIARIFNTYGPRLRLDDGRVVSNFIRAALTGDPLRLFGDGRQTRSFCYVDDLVEGLLRLMECGDEHPINLGNPHEVSIRDLAQRILALTNSESPIDMAPLPTDDPVRRRPDITRAGELLDWAPTTALDDGLRTTINDIALRVRSRHAAG